MAMTLKFVLITLCLVVSVLSDGVPLSLQGTWVGQVTYSSVNSDVPPNCCAGNYTGYALSSPGRFDVGFSVPVHTDAVFVTVTETSIEVTPTAPGTGTACEAGFPNNLTVTGVTHVSQDCYIGTFAFTPAIGDFGGYACAFSLTSTGDFAIDFVRCYWLALLSEPASCPNDASGPDGNLRLVVENQCAIFNAGSYSASSWYTNPTGQPWVHTYTPPDPNCPISAPTHGTLGTCVSPLTTGSSCSFACDAPDYQLTGPASITCTNGVLSTLQTCASVAPPPNHCGALIAPGQCQVGFTGAPSCCTKISDQTPTATVAAQGTNIHFEVTSNTLPVNYEYRLGLATSTSNFFTCAAGSVTVTPGNGSTQVNAWNVPVASLVTCLETQHVAPGLRYQGYVVMSLQYTPWGNGAFIGLYFFGVSIEFSNATSTFTLLTVTQELNGGSLNVLINPTATLRHCVSVPCTQEDPVYFSRLGDSEVYMVSVDTSGQAGTASVVSVVFEDADHHAIGFTSVTTLLTEGLNITFGFVVPNAAADARFLRVTVQITFNTGSDAEFVTEEWVALATQQKTYVAQTRFEIAASYNAATSATLSFVAAVAAVLLALVL